MMMEEDSGDTGSVSGDFMDDTESSGGPPSFAVPPGGMMMDSNDRASSIISDSGSVSPSPSSSTTTTTTTEPAAAAATTVASADPFDLLSMTSAPVPISASQINNNDNFDLFSQPTTGLENINENIKINNATQDLFGNAIDMMNAQESMIGGSVSLSTVTPVSSPKLKTAESGDLLGLTGDSAAASASAAPSNQVPPNDFMDSDFQTMPISAPATTTIDPFDDGNNLFPPQLPQQPQQPHPQPAQPFDDLGTTAENFQKMVASQVSAKIQHEPNQPLKVETSNTEPESPAINYDGSNDANEGKADENENGVATDSSTSIAAERSLPSQKEELDNQQRIVGPSENGASPPTEETSANTTGHNSIAEVATPKENNGKEEAAPVSPSPTRDAYEGSTCFEEVELSSPQGSSLDQDGNHTTTKQAPNLNMMEELKPPLLDDGEASSTVTMTLEQSAPVQTQNEAHEKKLKELQEQLTKAQQEMEKIKTQKEHIENQHRDSQLETANVLEELQNKLQEEITKRAEAENDAKYAQDEIKKLQKTLQTKEEAWQQQTEEWKQQLGGLEKENEALIAKAKQELEDRKEHERRERVLANKLNMLKKQQATKTDVEEVYEDDLRLLKEEVASKTKRVEELEAAKAELEEQLEQEKEMAKTRIEQLEATVREEKSLNEERKKKMKAFIESKADELKEAKAESEHYQTELNQTNQSMVDLNNRWKTLHAQWVQSQTRNRELQRDLNKIKKDSENLHKVGDSLNVKLSKSANETEQHKSKRLAAKQELMSVLAQLEMEREITNKLRDSVRFTFTPKAQSQHQLLQENLTEFQKQLEALARRLGRPIPLNNDANNQSLSSLVMAAVDESERMESNDSISFSTNGTNGGQDDKNGGPSKEQKRVLLETTRLLGKLENETQRISQNIMALTSAIEQMNQLIQGGGEKTCFTSLGGIFFGGGLAKALETDQGGRSGTAGRNRAPVRYGHSSHLPTESGTMT